MDPKTPIENEIEEIETEYEIELQVVHDMAVFESKIVVDAARFELNKMHQIITNIKKLDSEQWQS